MISNFIDNIRNLPETIRLIINNKTIYKAITSKKDKLATQNKAYKTYIDYISDAGKISVFNSEFEKQYDSNVINVQKDNSIGLPYVIYNQKKLYYKKSHNIKQIQHYHNGLLLEQDQHSPHCYLTNQDNLTNYIVFDLGAAEGIFSLSIVEQVKHIYMFEADSSWNSAVNQTFKPWKDKITLVNKFVSNKNTETSISFKDYLNHLLDTHQISADDSIFIKMDIEGFEKTVLEDIIDVLSIFSYSDLAICVYHNQEDESYIMNLLKNDYICNFQNGYMLFYYDKNITYPYFRHGVLRAHK